MTDAFVIGMHGLGDALHSRAVIGQLMKRHDRVWLESCWIAPFHDLIAQGLRVVRKVTPLRTQAKNANREAHLFAPREEVPADAVRYGITYNGRMVERHGSVLAAMSHNARVEVGDFRLPVQPEWIPPVKGGLPMMVYRPLTERAEWAGNVARNPDAATYAALFNSIRNSYFVVSVADYEAGKEWPIGEAQDHDLAYHHGELSFQGMAGLMRRSALVFTPPGFATILAQAVGTPAVTVFGGYERASSFSGGAGYAPSLFLEPDNPCGCWRYDHDCDKRMNLPNAIGRLRDFIA